MEKTLCSLKAGQAGAVLCIKPESSLRRRLLDLGLTCGTRVECLFRSPMGDPTAYLVRGAVVALRETDAGAVVVRPLTQGR